jgi:hypothetical protein
MVEPLLAGVPFWEWTKRRGDPAARDQPYTKGIRSNRQQILFLVREVRVDLADRLVGRGLNVFFQPL